MSFYILIAITAFSSIAALLLLMDRSFMAEEAAKWQQVAIDRDRRIALQKGIADQARTELADVKHGRDLLNAVCDEIRSGGDWINDHAPSEQKVADRQLCWAANTSGVTHWTSGANCRHGMQSGYYLAWKKMTPNCVRPEPYVAPAVCEEDEHDECDYDFVADELAYDAMGES